MPNPEPTKISAGLAFSALCNLRNTEGHLRWMGAQLGIVLNIPGWAAVATRTVLGPSMIELSLLVLGCVIFAIANWLLYEIQQRDTRLMMFWNRSLKRLEEANGIDGNVKIFTSKRYRKLEEARDRIGYRLRKLSVISIIMWVMLAIAALVFTLAKGA